MKKSINRLALNKITISNLDSQSMNQVLGGGIRTKTTLPGSNDGCTYSKTK